MSETTTTRVTAQTDLQTLHGAATTGDHDLIEKILAAHSTTSSTSSGGSSGEREEQKNKLFVDEPDESGRTALHMAAQGGHGRCIAALIRAGASINAQDKQGNTPLHCAAASGHYKTLKRLLRRTKEVDNRDSLDQTPFHLAIISGHSPICGILLEKGADVEKKNSMGATALHIAAMHGRSEVLRLILDTAAGRSTINYMDASGRTPLHCAVSGDGDGHGDGDGEVEVECARLLLEAGASHAPDAKGNLPLHLAASCAHSRCVSLLLEFKAPVAAVNESGATALHLASSHTAGGKCVELLLASGAAINAKDISGCTPLHYAARHGSASSTEVLLRSKAATSLQDVQSKTPLNYAMEGGFASVCALLANVGADITLRYIQPVVSVLTQEDPSVKIDHFGFSPDPSNPQKWDACYVYYEGLRPVKSSTERLRQQKWFKMLTQLSKSPTNQPKKLRSRAYKGIPDSLRGLAWRRIVQADKEKEQSQRQYSELLTYDSEYLKQIDLDINRTDRNHVMFAERYGLGQKGLFNVLKGYAVYDSDLGYTQGMSGITALLLMYMSEEDAFWMLVSLMNHKKYNFRKLFEPGFPRLYEQFSIHEQLVKATLPALAAHFQAQGIQTSMYATRWFLTMFGGMLPFVVLLRVWDLIIVEGYGVVHRAALSLLRLYQKELLNMRFEELMPFLLGTEWLQLDPDLFVNTIRKIRIPPNLPIKLDAL